MSAEPLTLKNIVAVYASDWGCYCEQIPVDHPFTVVKGWVYGEVLRESDEMIVIAHQVFEEGDGRHISTIPKVNIMKRVDFYLNPDGTDADAEHGLTHEVDCPHPLCQGRIKLDNSLPAGVHQCICQACSVRLVWTNYPDGPRVPSLELEQRNVR